MKAVHCKYCGLLLATWREREDHIIARQIQGGSCKAKTLSPADSEFRLKCEDAARRGRDRAKMLERLEVLNQSPIVLPPPPPPPPPTPEPLMWKPFLKVAGD